MVNLENKVALFFARTRFRGCDPLQLELAKREAVEIEDWSEFGDQEEDAKRLLLLLSSEKAINAWITYLESQRSEH